MQLDSEISADGQKKLASINRAGFHLLALINDVLDISRIEAGASVAKIEPFDLRALLSSSEEMMRPRADSKGLGFSVEIAAELPAIVDGDGLHLKQVLINVLGNAVKYTEQGQVSLRVKRRNGDIEFEIADSGPGISKEDQQRIFQPFYQTEAGISKAEGTGLGLAISLQYAHLMGGQLQVQSQLGVGSVFTLRLPLPSSAVAQAPAEPRLQRRTLAGGQPSVRVLVVDDKEDNRELVKLLLERAGFEVRSADDGQQAVAAFQTWQPHCICMDMRMPVLDGYEATRQIRALAGGDKVRIVALTASAFEEDRHEILAAGCDGLVCKPVEEARLFDLLAELLGLRYIDQAGQDGAALFVSAARSVALAELNLAALSGPELAQLKAAAAALDFSRMQELLSGLRAAHPQIVANLDELLQAFRFDRIGDLLVRASGE